MNMIHFPIVLSAATLALLAKFGLSVARHMPAPKAGSVVYRWIFDVIQDLAGNNDRIGEVRPTTVEPPATPVREETQ